MPRVKSTTQKRAGHANYIYYSTSGYDTPAGSLLEERDRVVLMFNDSRIDLSLVEDAKFPLVGGSAEGI